MECGSILNVSVVLGDEDEKSINQGKLRQVWILGQIYRGISLS
jgi:hypothetical protein